MARLLPFVRSVCSTLAPSLALAALMALATPIACNQPAGSAARLDSEDEGHGLHTVQNQRLADIMNELKALDFEGMARRASSGGADARLVAAARHAADLATDARLMPHLFKSETFTDEHRRVFDHLAGRLQIQCLELRDAASASNVPATRAKLEQVIRTCNECHASFRGPSMAWVRDDDVPY
ncbi:MAG: hypothetical protein HBSAPP02_11980 [Phycisphaerae bacterium]|nr:MAG: cytochrome c [Planctomycetia bacterium]RIK70496.1 MAG: hypothetical protein DCC66_04215 [Planctomycetota bacterium]GJQ26166.1 MAG: hypothetical protein HBSAPP02_11980 [Phycisphaerae bacterium]